MCPVEFQKSLDLSSLQSKINIIEDLDMTSLFLIKFNLHTLHIFLQLTHLNFSHLEKHLRLHA